METNNFEYNRYQKDILNNVQNSNENLLIDAKAGSGKTSTLLMIANDLISKNKKCLFLAFNKSIVNELSKKIQDERVLIKTVHSLGYSFIKSFLYRKHNVNYRINVDEELNKKLIINFMNEICLEDFMEANKDLPNEDLKELKNNVIYEMEFLMNYLRMHNANYHDKEVVLHYMNQSCTILQDYRNFGLKKFPLVIEKSIDQIKYNFENPAKEGDVYIYNISYTDMIYLPVYYNMDIPFSLKDKLDYIEVDECIPANTWITTNKGKKPMKILFKKYRDNKLGNHKVMTYNEETKEFEYKDIISVTTPGLKDVYVIKTDKKHKFEATGNHKFLTHNGYKRLDELILNEDYLVSDAGPENDELVISRKLLPNKRRVYDLEVKDNHNFLVSKMSQNALGYSVVVHNCQDLSVLQQKFISKLKKVDNRFILVGDSNQSIYSFARF